MTPDASSARWGAELATTSLVKLLANISDTVTVVDEAGQILFISGHGDGVLDYTTDDWAGRSIFDMVHPDDSVRAIELAGEVLSTRGVSRSEDLRLLDAAGEWADIEVSAVNLIDDPDVRGVVITSRNVSERLRAAEALVAARDSAVVSAEARMRLIAMVSHELRSPLHTIAGTAELLSMQLSDPGALESIHLIRAQVDLLSRLIDGLLDSGRSEAVGLELSLGRCDVVALAHEVVASVRVGLLGAEAGGSGPRTSVEVSGEVPAKVLLDEMRVRQVLTNLVGNALKFTAMGEVVVNISASRSDLVMTVRDTGPGIAPDQLAEIFDDYRRTESAAGTRGFGLGLAITYELVTAMGGSMTVESEVGTGSTFAVVLPLQLDRRASVRDRVPDRVAIRRGDVSVPGVPRVLIVDDSPVNRQLLTQQLGHFDVESIEAESGEQGLALLDESIALVIMDWHMPGMDGLEATRRIRASGWCGSVVGLTASVLDSERATCLEAGMDEVLGKPARLDDIGGVVERWLPRDDGGSDPAATVVPLEDPLAEDLGAVAALRLIETFLVEMPTRVDALRVAIGSDEDAVRQQAHALRSTAELMGSVTLAEICRSMEQSPASHGIDGGVLELTAARSAEELRRRAALICTTMEVGNP